MGNCETGLTFGQTAFLEKERIKHALEGEKCVGEDDDGYVWEPCSDAEADKEILSIFDTCVSMALNAMHEARAYEKIASDFGYDGNQDAWRAAMVATEVLDDYDFEGE